MTNMETIQAQDAALAVEHHYSKHGTSPQWIHDQLVRAGDAQATAEVNTIDAVLMRAPQPNARELSQYDNGKVRYNLPVRVIAMGLCVMGIIAMKVLS